MTNNDATMHIFRSMLITTAGVQYRKPSVHPRVWPVLFTYSATHHRYHESLQGRVCTRSSVRANRYPLLAMHTCIWQSLNAT